MKYSLAVLVAVFLTGISVSDALDKPKTSENEEHNDFLSTGYFLPTLSDLTGRVNEGAKQLEKIGSDVGAKFKRTWTERRQKFPLQDLTDTIRTTSGRWQKAAADTFDTAAQEGIKNGKALIGRLQKVPSGDLTGTLQAKAEQLGQIAPDIYNTVAKRVRKIKPVRARKEESYDDRDIEV